MKDKNYFRYGNSEPKENFLDCFQVLLEELYRTQKKMGKADKEKKGFVDGFMSAGIEMGLADMGELQVIIDHAHMEVFGKTVEERKALIRSAQLSEDVLDIPTFYRFGKKIDVE